MADTSKPEDKDQTLTKDEAVAQATALTDEAFNRISQGEYDYAIDLCGMALEKVVNTCGELAYESCKFYYFLADALLNKIENSTEILNDPGTANAKAMDSVNQKAPNLPQLLNNSADMVREMFEQMAKATENAPKEPSNTEAPVETNQSEPKIVETPAEVKPETKAPENTTEKCDKDEPVIKDEDDDEEEVITTTKPKKDDSPKPAEPQNGQTDNPNEETKQDLNQPNDNEYADDEFKAPWENLEVAAHIFEKTKDMHENPEEFEQLNWNLKADILERQADLEIAREATKEGIELYNKLVELCVKHKCDRAKSRTIACILYKIGCAHLLLDTGYQQALDNFHEAADILTLLMIEDVKLADPELGNSLTVIGLKQKNELEKLEVCTDKSAELKSICLEICNKIEECTIAITEKPILDKERKKEETSNTFKKPMLEDKPAIQLGSFGKGKKRTHDQMQSTPTPVTTDDKKENLKPEDMDKTKETEGNKSEETTPAKANPEQGSEGQKRQKIDEL